MDITKKNVEIVTQLEKAVETQRTFGTKMADKIAAFCGKPLFAGINFVVQSSWIAWNALAPKLQRFDPFPFPFLTLMLSIEAIFLTLFVLISQNREAELANNRNHLDLQVNLLSEQENTKTLQLLECIANKLGIPVHDDELKQLEEAAQPETIIQQIEEAKQHE